MQFKRWKQWLCGPLAVGCVALSCAKHGPQMASTPEIKRECDAQGGQFIEARGICVVEMVKSPEMEAYRQLAPQAFPQDSVTLPGARLESKALAGDPSEMAMMRLPEPAQRAVTVDANSAPIYFSNESGGRFEQKMWLPEGEWILSITRPSAEPWEMTLSGPQSQTYALAQKDIAPVIGYHEAAQTGAAGEAPVNEIYSVKAKAAGEWVLTVQTTRSANTQKSDARGMVTWVSPQDPYQLYFHFSDFEHRVGKSLGFNVFLAPKKAEVLTTEEAAQTPGKVEKEITVPPEAPVPEPIKAIERATLTLFRPQMAPLQVTLRDNGQNADGAAEDGRLGALLDGLSEGQYSARVEVWAKAPTGEALYYRIEQFFAVAPTLFDLHEEVKTERVDEGRTEIRLIGDTKAEMGTPLFVYGELWGSNGAGQEEAIAWMGGARYLQRDAEDKAFVALVLDHRWLSRSGLKAPFVLKSVRVQEADTQIVIASRARMAVSLDEAMVNSLAPITRDVSAITPEMREGEAPQWFKEAQARAAQAPARQEKINTVTSMWGGDDGIMIVHGWCEDNPWNQKRFTDTDHYFYRGDNYFYEHPGDNISNDRFARQIAAEGNSRFKNFFSVVAHSQGGMAAVHLRTFYWSKLNLAEAYGVPRPIQSVGTPYAGTSLMNADMALSFATLFWLSRGRGSLNGCGLNYDLTTWGARSWLNNIPSHVRQLTHVYTTTHRIQQRWWHLDFWNYICNFWSSIWLNGPDDGTSSLYSARALAGAHIYPNREERCHVSGMRYMAQCEDQALNDEMDYYGRPAPICGNGRVERWKGETCEDGNTINTDACTSVCQVARCGDGFVWAGQEFCDQAEFNGKSGYCSADCSSLCGNGTVEGAEVCDNGAANGQAGKCNQSCSKRLPLCGNGVTEEGEVCDEGAGNGGPGHCNLSCNGTVAIPVACGNSMPDPGEACDDGNMSNEDGCLNSCKNATCGDGYVQTGKELCDDGANNGLVNRCSKDCQSKVLCGNRVVDYGEQCDDGNSTDHDGCDSCRLDATCTGGVLVWTGRYVDIRYGGWDCRYLNSEYYCQYPNGVKASAYWFWKCKHYPEIPDSCLCLI